MFSPSYMTKSPEYILCTCCEPGMVLGPEDGALNKTALAPCCHDAHGPEKQRARELTEVSFQMVTWAVTMMNAGVRRSDWTQGRLTLGSQEQVAGFSKLKHPGLLSKFGSQVNDKSIFSMSHAAFVTYL